MWRWAECELSLCLLPRIKYLLGVLARFFIHTHTHTHTHTHSLCSEVLLIQPVRQRGDTDRLLFTQSLVHQWELRGPPEAQARTSATVQTSIKKNVSSVFSSCFYFFLAVGSVSCFFSLVFKAASKCFGLRHTCRTLRMRSEEVSKSRAPEKLTFHPVHRDSQADKSLLQWFTYPQFIAIRTRCHMVIEKHVEVKVIKWILWL